MAQQVAPQFEDDYEVVGAGRRSTRPVARPIHETSGVPHSAEGRTARRGLLAALDTPLVVVVVLLLAVGAMMVYSTTFDWSAFDFGTETYILFQHLRNMVIGGVILVLLASIDYRIWKRFAVVILLGTIATLIAVLLFSDSVFGARRSFLNGSYQPGELAELVMVLYMAAWLGSKRSKVGSFFNGLLPFTILLAIVGGLIMLQPDLSTAITIFAVTGTMYFLAGANVYHMLGIGGLLAGGALLVSRQREYAQDRLNYFSASISGDLAQSAYHTQQAIIAFINGGWSGVGLGQGRQKFGFLPAPHTDSIFAVIGEELGVLGAAFVVGLFIVFVVRGLRIARFAPDSFGMLLGAGITLWIIMKAMFNIAVMLSLVPPTGVALPFISFGGSSLVVVMGGVGLLLSIARVTTRLNAPEGRTVRADHDRGWGNRWSRVSGFSRGRGDSTAPAGR